MKGLLCLLLLIPSIYTLSQGRVPYNNNFSFLNASVVHTGSGDYLIFPHRSGCKNFSNDSLPLFQNADITFQVQKKSEMSIHSDPVFVIHGNVSYNFNYRSYLDTPFAETDLMQHSVQTRLNVKLKDRYPFTVNLAGRYSNSPFFSNESNVSVQFRQQEMLEDIKRKMLNETDSILRNKAMVLTPAQVYKNEMAGIINNPGSFNSREIKKSASKYTDAKTEEISKKYKELYGQYKSAADKLNSLKDIVHRSPGQEAVEAKERKLLGEIKDSVVALSEAIFKKKAGVRIFKADSMKRSVEKKMENKKDKYDSLQNQLARAEKNLKSYQKKIIDSLQQVKKQIASIKDKNGLFDYFRKKGEAVQGITGLQKALLSVRQVGIGRTWIDYSELTVKNISLTGANLEANPGNIYFAAAVGKVNYRFRDYIVKGNYTGSGQSVALLRAGFGKKDGNNFIITYYTGKKALLNQTVISGAQTVRKITGFSVESRAALDANNYIIGEYARSITPGIRGKILSFNTHNNEAWGLKLFSTYNNTKFTGYFRRMGEGFQSFTLYPTGSRQDAWLAKLSQSFWKKRVTAEAAIRKNDFNSPIALPDFSNKNIFKSFQLTVRVPKYPFVMIGYYPSSQLVLSNNKTLYENRYNTLNSVISHSYYLGGLSMGSNLCYTKFYNTGSDTGFIYYNAASLSFNHSVFIKHLTLGGTGTLTDQSQLYQLTLEPELTWRPKNSFSLSSSVKWSRVNHVETLWGGTAGINWLIKKLGTVQLRWEKIWLPGYRRNLLPVDIGRLTYSREF